MKNVFATSALILACGLSAGSSFAAYTAPQTRLNTHDTSSFFTPEPASVRSRTEVKGEVINTQQARAGLNTKESSSHFPKSTPSTLSREAVRADFLQAQKAGILPPMGDRG